MAIIYDIHQHDLEMRTRTLSESKPLTGYPSIDKPWLKYYSDKAINMPLPKCTMFQYVYDNNKDYSADIALQYYGKRITYGQLFERIRCAASAFWAMGVRGGDIVTIMSMHTPETIYAIYALNYIGAVANMVYMTLAEKEILRTLDSTESKMLLVLDAALDRILPIKDKLAVPVVVLGLADSMPLHMKLCCGLKTGHWKHGFLTWRSFNERGAHEPPMAVDGSALAVIVYTSGTTGAPKGVMLSNSEVNALAYQDINGIIGLRRNLATLFILPPFIGYGYSHLHVGLSAGLVMQLQIDLTPTKVAKELFKNQAECFCAGPAFLDAILEHGASDLSKLEYFICGGGEISREKELEVNAFLNKCHSKATYSNGYGMTEASSVLCVNCNEICKIGSLGIPAVKTNVKVLDSETGKELRYREEGELYFSTPSLMEGYYKNEEATAETIVTDKDGTKWLRTGDLGYVDDDGFVFMSGRIKRIFYVRTGVGEICRLFPAHIEDVIERNAIVASSAVVVKEDKERIGVPIAYITVPDAVKKTEKRRAIDNLAELLVTELSEHMLPRKIIVLDAMPITQSGKVDYRTLEEMAKEDARHA